MHSAVFMKDIKERSLQCIDTPHLSIGR